MSSHKPCPADAVCVAAVTIEDCQAILAKPVDVPLLARVAPEGIVIVSPLSPSCRPVPDLGLTLFTFTSLI